MKHPIVKARQSIKTRKNEALMKQCYRDLYKIGMVSSKTMRKVERTVYSND